MVTISPRQIALGTLIALSACAAARAEALPRDGRFNLQCSVAIRTVSGPPVPAKINPSYAVDLGSKTWCNVEDHCAQRYALHKVSETVVEFTITDAVTDHEKFLVNLETGKLAGSADDAPNGLINGFRTYLAEGDCVSQPYSEGRQP